MPRFRAGIAVVLALVVISGAVSLAQRFGVFEGAGAGIRTPPKDFTNVRVSRNAGDLNYWAVRLTDDQVFECPILIGSDVGTATLSKTEAQRLREYLLKGGFLWVDDFWGTPAWDQWSSEIKRVLPEHPIFDIPADHPIRH